MNNTFPHWILGLALTWAATQFSGARDLIHDQDAGAFDAASGGPAPRQYAPSRKLDLLHLALDVTPDFQHRSLTGTATLEFEPIAMPLDELELDAVDLNIQEVSSSEDILGWQAADDQLIVTFTDPILPAKKTTVTIRYSATPRKGLYFRTPELGYRAEDMHLFTQGEAISARHWYPCFDAPNEFFTSEITCRVPRDMTVLSNGRMMSTTEEEGTGRVAVRWLQDKPHVNYLISLVAGHLEGIKDRYGDVPLAFYTPASEIQYATNSFHDTKDMLAYFEEEIGVPFPWDKYYQVCVRDFVAGGMENTSLTTLTDRTLHPAELEPLRSSRGLVAHELAHQWFGDLVTCKDWAHVWLNEGFATYYEKLYARHKEGGDEFRYQMYRAAQGIVNRANDVHAIVRRDFQNPDEQFGYLAYPKGAWILHMLRCQLGEPLFRECIRTYLQRHAHRNVETADLVRILEEFSGRSFDRFFDQYVYHAHHPELQVGYRWDERSKLAKISVRQEQKLSDNVLLFEVPLTVRFVTPKETVDRELPIQRLQEDFYVSLPRKPTIVRIDPEPALLAKITFNPPAAMLTAQLTNTTDMLGRLLAVEHLGKKQDEETVARLKDRLNADPFYGVRLAASKALRGIATDAAFEALKASLDQPDLRVRKQVAEDLTSFYRQPAYAAAHDLLATETNPEIQAVAVKSLGAYSNEEVPALLHRFLATPSFQNEVALAAIAAMRQQDDPQYVEPLLAHLRTNATAFTARGFGRALNTVAWLTRNEDDRAAVRQFLLGHVHDPRSRVQRAAIDALGTLGDPKAIAPLERLAIAETDREARETAERSLKALRDVRKPGAELGDLRKDVLDLRKANEDLRKELDDLKKQFEALSSADTAGETEPAEPSEDPAREARPDGTQAK